MHFETNSYELFSTNYYYMNITIIFLISKYDSLLVYNLTYPANNLYII